MPYSPPKKATLIISLIFELLGIIIGLLGLYGYGYLLPISLGMNNDTLFVIVGFLLTLIGWLIVYLGVRLRGL